MPTVEKISIALTEDMAALVREAVESGEYVSTSEVIREALRDWKHRRALAHEELRRLWQEGIESGSAGELDIEEIKREARAAPGQSPKKNLQKSPKQRAR
jgi:antitoxin ParD1/3/4